MDSLKSVWQSILDEIAKNITSTAYNTWFSDCEPVELGETSLIIQTTSDFKRSVIQGRFDLSSCVVDHLSDLGTVLRGHILHTF